MEKERFEAIVAAYGAEPRRWPAAERAAALAFAASDHKTLSDARITDALLDAVPPAIAPNDVLEARIVRSARAARPPLAAGLALAACALIGVMAGYGAGRAAPAPQEIDTMLAATFDAPAFLMDDAL